MDAVLVAGGRGLLARDVCRRLCERGVETRALVRPRDGDPRDEELRALGVELVQGDLERPETLGPAVDGVDAVVSPASSFPVDPRPDAIERVDRDGQLALVAAAERAGVRRFLHVSFRPIPWDFAFQRAKRAVEDALRGASLEHTVLQPTKFMEVWFSPPLGFDVAAGRVRIYGDGTTRTAWISYRDVAEIAVRSLSADAARNATIELRGPEALSQDEVIAIFEEELGRPLEREPLPRAELERMLASASNALEESLAGVMLDVTVDSTTDLRPVPEQFPLRLATVRDVARSAR
jgi:uncharacterized protein YbjT (DUF2867 family)